MIILNEKFNWNLFDYTRFKEIGVKYSFGTSYGEGYCSKPINHIRRQDKVHRLWSDIMRKCFADEESIVKNNEIAGTICKEWLDYAAFLDWYNENYYEIDGEIINLTRTCFAENNTHFSPEYCVFAPLRIVKALKTYGDKDKELGKNGEVLPKGIYYVPEYDYYNAWAKYDGSIYSIGVGDDIIELQSLTKIIQKAELQRLAEHYKDKIPMRLYERMKTYDYDMGEIRYEEKH